MTFPHVDLLADGSFLVAGGRARVTSAVSALRDLRKTVSDLGRPGASQ